MAVSRTIGLYRWYKFSQNLLFWQAVWFLYFQDVLSGAEAVALYALLELSITLLEVPSGYLSDRIGRRRTLVASALCGGLGCVLIYAGSGALAFGAGLVLIGAGGAFASGTDTALLYEALSRAGRGDDIETQELIAWRYSFAGLAVSAVAGGIMAQADPALPFAATALAFAAQLALVLCLDQDGPGTDGALGEGARLRALGAALRQPVLLWLMALVVGTYALGHIPFVFGQPYIASALSGIGLAGEAPIVSGIVTAAMMALSVLATWAAGPVRARLGLRRLFLAYLGAHVALTLVLALTNAAGAILFLLLRKVPDSLARAFVTARIHPLIPDSTRATYLSLVSLVARLAFSGSLFIAAFWAERGAALSYAALQGVLLAYAAAGGVLWVLLWAGSRRLGLDQAP